jgi:hypothetical protein
MPLKVRGLSSNMALNLAPFGRWTLRDKAAQRQLAPLLDFTPTFSDADR